MYRNFIAQAVVNKIHTYITSLMDNFIMHALWIHGFYIYCISISQTNLIVYAKLYTPTKFAFHQNKSKVISCDIFIPRVGILDSGWSEAMN